MELTVPYIYQASVKPEHDSTDLEVVCVKSAVTVKIKEATSEDAPVAIIVSGKELRWDGKQLWEEYLLNSEDEYSPAENKNTKAERISVSKAELIAHTTYGNIVSRPIEKNALNPFGEHVIFDDNVDFLDQNRAINQMYANKRCETKENIPAAAWRANTHHAVESQIKKTAKKLLLVDDVLYRKALEPIYLLSFGKEKGGLCTASLTVRYARDDIYHGDKHTFSAKDSELATQAAVGIAYTRGLRLKSNVSIAESEMINVFIPEAVQFDSMR